MKKTKTAINIIIGIFLIYTFQKNFELADFRSLAYNFDPTKTPAICLLYALSLLANGYASNKLTLEIFGIKTNFNIWFGLSAASAFANLIMPLRAGTVFKAYYLRKKYSFEVSKSAGIFLFSSAVSIITISLISAIFFALPILNYRNIDTSTFIEISPEKLQIILMAFATSISIIGLLFLTFCHLKELPLIINDTMLKGKILKFTRKIHFGIQLLLKSPKTTLAFTVNAIISLSINVGALSFAYESVGIDVSITELAIINLFLTFSFYISITPGNLGIQELTIASSSIILGIPYEAGLVSALIVRAASTITIVSLGWPYLHNLSKEHLESRLF